jgi:phosphoglycolate phosphatase-like HAD superfamily hydrolase
MKNVKMVVFDMDGTIADLYSVNGWLEMLRAFDPTPYIEAKPMWDMEELATVLNCLRVVGIEIRIVTWLSMETTKEYDSAVRLAKREWLEQYGFPFDHFHGVAYGATKADSVRRYLAENEGAILIDDNAKVREGWHLGEAIDPTEIDIVEYLKGLLTE